MPTSREILVVAPGIDGVRLDDAVRAMNLTAASIDPDRRSLAPAGAGAVIVHAFASDPGALLEAARAAGVPSILACAPGPDAAVPPPGVSEPDCIQRVASLTADAYIWRWSGIRAALSFVLAEDRDARRRGAPRLVFLGHAGADFTRASAPAIGISFPLPPAGQKLLIGRPTQSDVAIAFTTSVARHHAVVEQREQRVFFSGLASTNGTWLGGRRIENGWLDEAAELAVAGFLRLRLDGLVR